VKYLSRYKPSSSLHLPAETYSTISFLNRIERSRYSGGDLTRALSRNQKIPARNLLEVLNSFATLDVRVGTAFSEQLLRNLFSEFERSGSVEWRMDLPLPPVKGRGLSGSNSGTSSVPTSPSKEKQSSNLRFNRGFESF
jgi:hypothetical protein